MEEEKRTYLDIITREEQEKETMMKQLKTIILHHWKGKAKLYYLGHEFEIQYKDKILSKIGE